MTAITSFESFRQKNGTELTPKQAQQVAEIVPKNMILFKFDPYIFTGGQVAIDNFATHILYLILCLLTYKTYSLAQILELIFYRFRVQSSSAPSAEEKVICRQVNSDFSFSNCIKHEQTNSLKLLLNQNLVGSNLSANEIEVELR